MRRGEGMKSRPGAKSTAATAELREHLGREGPKDCGLTAEELRKLSSLSPFFPAADRPEPGPAPALVRVDKPAKRREGFPAAPPQSGACPYVASRYGSSRNWAVMHGGELVAVVTYRKGAAELVRRLNAGRAALMAVGFEQLRDVLAAVGHPAGAGHPPT